MAVLPVNKREQLIGPIELTVRGDRVGHRSGMVDERIPSLLRFDERRVSRLMNSTARRTFRQPPGQALGCYRPRSNGLQPHCQQYHLMMIAVSPLQLTVRNGQRASNDDVIVGICWELGGLIVDRSVGLHEDDREKYESPHAHIHGDALQHLSPFLCLRGR